MIIMSDGTRLWAGIAIIMISFFGGFFMMINSLMADDISIFMILFYALGIPLIGILIGMPLMMKGMGGSRRLTPFGLFGVGMTTEEPSEASYVHEPPNFCSDCGANLSMENVEWAGPLTVKCPYCGNTMKTEKRKI
jgi:hypothetical protein